MDTLQYTYINFHTTVIRLEVVFYREFTNFASSHSLVSPDINLMPVDSFTYVSRSSECATSWLDHILCSDGNLVQNIKILYGFTFEDHIPLYFEFYAEYSPSPSSESSLPHVEANFVAWDKVSELDIEMYSEYLEESSMSLISGSLLCRENRCNSQNHAENLEKIYSSILELLSEASNFLPCRNSDGFFRRVGWNDHCKILYDTAREKFLAWKISGKPRDGHLFTDMKNSRKLFRNSLNYCHKNELEIKKRKLLESFRIENKNRFWKNVQQMNKISDRQQNTIDNQTDLDEIIKIFDLQYRTTLDDPYSQSNTNCINFKFEISPRLTVSCHIM